jgi:hypothetical protein
MASSFNEEINNDYAEIMAGDSDSDWPCHQQEFITNCDEQVGATQTKIGQSNLIEVVRDSPKETPALVITYFHAYFTNLVAGIDGSVAELKEEIKVVETEMRTEVNRN